MGILLLFLNQTMKKVLERAVLKLPFQDGVPIQRAILGGVLEWKGTLRVPLQPGCPRVCPPWAHRSYATGAGILMSRQIYKCLQSVNLFLSRSSLPPAHGNPKLTVTSVYAPTEGAALDNKN